MDSPTEEQLPNQTLLDPSFDLWDSVEGNEGGSFLPLDHRENLCDTAFSHQIDSSTTCTKDLDEKQPGGAKNKSTVHQGSFEEDSNGSIAGQQPRPRNPSPGVSAWEDELIKAPIGSIENQVIPERKEQGQEIAVAASPHGMKSSPGQPTREQAKRIDSDVVIPEKAAVLTENSMEPERSDSCRGRSTEEDDAGLPIVDAIASRKEIGATQEASFEGPVEVTEKNTSKQSTQQKEQQSLLETQAPTYGQSKKIDILKIHCTPNSIEQNQGSELLSQKDPIQDIACELEEASVDRALLSQDKGDTWKETGTSNVDTLPSSSSSKNKNQTRDAMTNDSAGDRTTIDKTKVKNPNHPVSDHELPLTHVKNAFRSQRTGGANDVDDGKNGVLSASHFFDKSTEKAASAKKRSASHAVRVLELMNDHDNSTTRPNVHNPSARKDDSSSGPSAAKDPSVDGRGDEQKCSRPYMKKLDFIDTKEALDQGKKSVAGFQLIDAGKGGDAVLPTAAESPSLQSKKSKAFETILEQKNSTTGLTPPPVVKAQDPILRMSLQSTTKETTHILGEVSKGDTSKKIAAAVFKYLGEQHKTTYLEKHDSTVAIESSHRKSREHEELSSASEETIELNVVKKVLISIAERKGKYNSLHATCAYKKQLDGSREGLKSAVAQTSAKSKMVCFADKKSSQSSSLKASGFEESIQDKANRFVGKASDLKPSTTSDAESTSEDDAFIFMTSGKANIQKSTGKKKAKKRPNKRRPMLPPIILSPVAESVQKNKTNNEIGKITTRRKLPLPLRFNTDLSVEKPIAVTVTTIEVSQREDAVVTCSSSGKPGDQDTDPKKAHSMPRIAAPSLDRDVMAQEPRLEAQSEKLPSSLPAKEVTSSWPEKSAMDVSARMTSGSVRTANPSHLGKGASSRSKDSLRSLPTACSSTAMQNVNANTISTSSYTQEQINDWIEKCASCLLGYESKWKSDQSLSYYFGATVVTETSKAHDIPVYLLKAAILKGKQWPIVVESALRMKKNKKIPISTPSTLMNSKSNGPRCLDPNDDQSRLQVRPVKKQRGVLGGLLHKMSSDRTSCEGKTFTGRNGSGSIADKTHVNSQIRSSTTAQVKSNEPNPQSVPSCNASSNNNKVECDHMPYIFQKENVAVKPIGPTREERLQLDMILEEQERIMDAVFRANHAHGNADASMGKDTVAQLGDLTMKAEEVKTAPHRVKDTRNPKKRFLARMLEEESEAESAMEGIGIADSYLPIMSPTARCTTKCVATNRLQQGQISLPHPSAMKEKSRMHVNPMETITNSYNNDIFSPNRMEKVPVTDGLVAKRFRNANDCPAWFGDKTKRNDFIANDYQRKQNDSREQETNSTKVVTLKGPSKFISSPKKNGHANFFDDLFG
jgi:hypothetical protein